MLFDHFSGSWLTQDDPSSTDRLVHTLRLLRLTLFRRTTGSSVCSCAVLASLALPVDAAAGGYPKGAATGYFEIDTDRAGGSSPWSIARFAQSAARKAAVEFGGICRHCCTFGAPECLYTIVASTQAERSVDPPFGLLGKSTLEKRQLSLRD
jgi:hypothetical protein